MAKPRVTFVIMAGGKGERLWPLVRARTPKVCLSPTGKESLIQQTIDRLRPVCPQAGWLVITTRGQEKAIRGVLGRCRNIRVLAEPKGKNTAACIALAAVAVAGCNPRRLMVAVPADHWIGDSRAYRRAVRAAIAAASAKNCLVSIGIRPKAAHTGLGYLCTKAGITAKTAGVFPLERFVEKPLPSTAQRLIRKPGTFWNSGLFIGRAEHFLELIARYLPKHARALIPLKPFFARSAQQRLLERRLASAYRKLQSISFDRGVMQHVREALVVEGRFDWEDLGSWDVWTRLRNGSSRSPVLIAGAKNVSVVGEPGHLIAAVGIRDVVIVQTSNATLICRCDRAQDVRAVVRKLASQRRLARYL